MPADEAPGAELLRLRRQLARERARRESAEQIGDRLTSELYASVEELRRTQAEILDRSERVLLVDQVARRLRQVQDPVTLVDRCAGEIGLLVGLDRCLVHVIGSELGAALGDWSDSGDLPRPARLTQLPKALASHLAEHPGPDALVVDELGASPGHGLTRLSGDSVLGCRSVAAVAIRSTTRQLGWVVMLSVEPRHWSEWDLAVCDGVAQDLGARMLELQSAQERESLRHLEELDRAKDELISTVSHELRTPLTSVRGYLELLDAGDLGPLSAHSARAVRIMTRNVERLDTLVENLLQLSAQGAAPALDLHPVDLRAVVAECHSSLAPQLASNGLVLSVTATPDLRPVLGDRGLVEQVLLNLLSNAVKFTPAGGRVSVDLANAGAGVVLTVTDTGVGIPEDELESVFSRFFRSTLSVASGIPGTGLGLAVTKSIIELHGGRVGVMSTVEVGTAVRVELPAVPEDHPTG